jgi:UDP-N-acetyl-D-galactosamine dehydrogenase
MQNPTLSSTKIAVVGLGYVGLPLAVEFGKHFDTVGFDIQVTRVDELRAGRDHTQETPPEELAAAGHLRFSTDIHDLAGCNVFIVTVPTPVDEANRPDLSPLQRQHRQGAQAWRHRDLRIDGLSRHCRGKLPTAACKSGQVPAAR